MTARRQREFRRRRQRAEWQLDLQRRLAEFEAELGHLNRQLEVAGLGIVKGDHQVADAPPVAGRGHEAKSLASKNPPQPAGDEPLGVVTNWTHPRRA